MDDIELVDVVNNNGDYTGEVLDRDTVRNLKLKHWEVLVFIINSKGQMLLQKRSSNKKYNPNKLAPLAGGVIHGESVEDAALREVREELGVSLTMNDLNILVENADLTRIYYIVLNMKENEFVIQKEELDSVKWYDIDDVIGMIKNHDENITIKENRLDVIEKLKNII